MNISALNAKLSEVIAYHYHRLRSANPTVESSSKAIGANELFYHWQTVEGGWEVLSTYLSLLLLLYHGDDFDDE